MYKLSYIRSGQFEVETFATPGLRADAHNKLMEHNKYCNRDEKVLQITRFEDGAVEVSSTFNEMTKTRN